MREGISRLSKPAPERNRQNDSKPSPIRIAEDVKNRPLSVSKHTDPCLHRLPQLG